MSHLIPPHQLIAIAFTATEEASIMVLRALDLRLEVPTSIEDLEVTMQLIHVMTAAHRALREVGGGNCN